jgi:hypothetical protein
MDSRERDIQRDGPRADIFATTISNRRKIKIDQFRWHAVALGLEACHGQLLGCVFIFPSIDNIFSQMSGTEDLAHEHKDTCCRRQTTRVLRP